MCLWQFQSTMVRFCNQNRPYHQDFYVTKLLKLDHFNTPKCMASTALIQSTIPCDQTRPLIDQTCLKHIWSLDWALQYAVRPLLTKVNNHFCGKFLKQFKTEEVLRGKMSIYWSFFAVQYLLCSSYTWDKVSPPEGAATCLLLAPPRQESPF